MRHAGLVINGEKATVDLMAKRSTKQLSNFIFELEKEKGQQRNTEEGQEETISPASLLRRVLQYSYMLSTSTVCVKCTYVTDVSLLSVSIFCKQHRTYAVGRVSLQYRRAMLISMRA